MTVTITLPGVPPSINRFAGRENTWEYRSQKQYWTDLVYIKSISAGIPRGYCSPDKARVEICYTFPTKGRRDPDNYAGKFILDGLTKAGLIQDDSFGHIQLVLDAEPVPGKASTRITVTPIGGNEKK